MNADEVKQRTGFLSMSMLLSFIFVACDGDINLIQKRCSPLTWLEEWFFYFEFKWGRSLTNGWTATDKYGPDKKVMRTIFLRKLALVKRARRRWPLFASYEEDMLLRKPKWNIKFQERGGDKFRIVMWDMTGINSYKSASADLQRVTYSK